MSRHLDFKLAQVQQSCKSGSQWHVRCVTKCSSYNGNNILLTFLLKPFLNGEEKTFFIPLLFLRLFSAWTRTLLPIPWWYTIPPSSGSLSTSAGALSLTILSSTLKMEAAYTSEMSATLTTSAACKDPRTGSISTLHHCDSLNSDIISVFLFWCGNLLL
jgi:hypothetical protein